MSLIDESFRVALADFYYLKRNFFILFVSSLVTPLLYLVAFGYGLGNGVTMSGVDYIAFMIPGVISLTTLSATFDTVSHKIMVQKRFYESFDEMLLCPISKSSIIIGRSFLGVFKGMVTGSVLIVMGYFLSSDFHVSLWLILIMIFSCFVFSVFGVAVGILIGNLAQMSVFTSFVILPMTFLCGTMFSLDALPGILSTFIDLLPLTQTTACIRALALDWAFPLVHLAGLVLYGVVFYILAYWALGRSH